MQTEAIQSFMKKIGLTNFFPEKITLNDVLCKAMEVKKPDTLEFISWNYLSQILMANSDARDVGIRTFFSRCRVEPSADFVAQKNLVEDQDQLKSIIGEISDDDDDDDVKSLEEVNPLDIVLSTFICCSPLLKRLITTKLNMCRLAVPLIYQMSNQSFTCFLWPLRSLASQRLHDDGIKYEDALIDQPNKVVTFLRIGNTSISKSEMVNKILSDKYHNTFYHRNCPLGHSPRILSNGTVEISWYFPNGNEDDVFKNTLAFLNLRGDACKEETLTNALIEVSNLIVAFMDSRFLQNDTENIFQNIHKKKIPVIFCMDTTSHSGEDFKLTLRKYVLNAHIDSSLLKVIPIMSNESLGSVANMMQVFRKTIFDFLQLKSYGKSLKECIPLFQKFDIKCDEDTKLFQQANEITNVIMEKIGDKPKFEILPLQSKLWKKWSVQLKAYNRVGTSAQYKDKNQIEKKMHYLREQQVAILNHMSPVMKIIIDCLIEINEKKQNDFLKYFFDYLQQKLDCHSRKVIPQFSNEYQLQWNKWKAAVDNNQTGIIEDIRKEVDGAENKLYQSYFGLEHVIREFGQMFESAIEISPENEKPTTRFLIKQLPEIVARIVLQGFPFEIMDGDASNVPMAWISAVFSNLQTLIGKPKLLTISILGLQSSGKSTLLNCMFGLEFPVRAGRCTRGVFLRLLPVPSGDYPFDYILVVDTEGLRAPELRMLKYDHDNELATFVIGIGDITLINIKGENTSEVQDVLQIAVHAFMKLVLVNNRIKLNQSCIFVHQNVSIQDAKAKLVHATQKTVETLDKMTEEAADQLHIANIQTFKQVIHFDNQQDVWFLPDLWYGDPPMAPSNPGYSKLVEELRGEVLSDKTNRTSNLTLEETSQRINDLWKGILTEDFIFSFRNSLEIKAFIKVERKFQELSSQIRVFVFNYFQNVIKGKLAFCNTEQELEVSCRECKHIIRECVERELEITKKDLEIFFDDNTFKDIVIIWKDATMIKLTNMTEECILNAFKDVDRKKEDNKLILLNTTTIQKDEREINQRVKELTQEMKGKKPSEEELKQQFDSIINDWIKRHKPPHEKRHEQSMTDQVEAVMVYRLSTIGSYIKGVEIKQTIPYTKIKTLIDSITMEDIHRKHISISSFLQKDTLKKDKFKRCAKKTLDITNRIFLKSDSAVSKRIGLDERFNSVFITELLDIIMTEIDNFNDSESNGFKILDTYKALLAVHVCKYATVVYGKMNEKYELTHGWKAHVRKYKSNMWKIFYYSVQEKAKEYIAASLLKNVVVESAIKQISEVMTEDIKSFLRGEIGSTKHALMTMILDKLADEESFTSLTLYLNCTEEFAYEWTVKYAKSKLFESTCGNENKYCKIAHRFSQKILKCVTESITFATENTKGISLETWINHFTTNVNSSLPLAVFDFRHLYTEVPEGNINDFSDFVRREMETMEQVILANFKSKTKQNIVWCNEDPIRSLFVELWGCNKHCPFCREPCQITMSDHLDITPHKCLQHRIPGLVGCYNIDTDELSIMICNSSVMETRTNFSCAVCERECKKSGECQVTDENDVEQFHSYKEYKKYIPDWDIAPDSTLSVADYWAWVTVTFKDKINERDCKGKLPEIPESWTRITKQQAKNSLRKQN